jgi:TP901 family phage tail tape measure protein
MADIILQIGLDNKELDNSLGKTIKISQREGERAGKGFAENFSTQIKNIAIGNIIADATRGAIRLFSSEVRQGIGALRGLSAATAEANSILGQSEKITKGVSQQFAEFSKQFGTPQQTQVKAFYNIVSGGIQGTSQRLEVLRVANKAAVAGLVDIDTAANTLVSSVNAYSSSGLTASQASDALFTAVRLGQTTFGELSSTIGQVAPLANSLGITFDELTGSIAGITTGGIATAQTVTGLRALLTGIVKPSKEAADAARALGIELGENAIRSAGGFANFLEILIDRTGGSADQLSRLFTSTEALTPILSIASRGVAGFRATLDQTRLSAGSTSGAFDELRQSIDFEFKQIEAELESFRIELAQGILPAIKELIPALRQLLPLFVSLADSVATVGRGAAGIAGLLSSTDNGNVNKLAQTYTRLSAELRGTQDQLERIEQIQQRGAINDEERFLLGRRRFLIEQRDRLEAERFIAQQRLAQTGGQQFGPEAPEQPGAQVLSDDIAQAPIKPPAEIAEENISAINLISQAYSSATSNVIDNTLSAQERIQALRQSFVDIGNTARVSFAGGIATAFAQVGQALANGENALKAFGQAVLGTIGQIAQQVGQSFILQGIGISLNPLLGGPAVGGPLIAAGAALSIFGGALSAFSGGGSNLSPGAAGAGGASRSFESETLPPISRDEEERRADQNVQLIVQGDILDSEDTGKRLLDLLNDNFKSNNGTFVGARFA